MRTRRATLGAAAPLAALLLPLRGGGGGGGSGVVRGRRACEHHHHHRHHHHHHPDMLTKNLCSISDVVPENQSPVMVTYPAGLATAFMRWTCRPLQPPTNRSLPSQTHWPGQEDIHG